MAAFDRGSGRRGGRGGRRRAEAGAPQAPREDRPAAAPAALLPVPRGRGRRRRHGPTTNSVSRRVGAARSRTRSDSGAGWLPGDPPTTASKAATRPVPARSGAGFGWMPRLPPPRRRPDPLQQISAHAGTKAKARGEGGGSSQRAKWRGRWWWE